MEPVVFEIRLADFDLDLLPVDRELLKKQPALLEQAVAEWFRGQLKELGGAGEVSVSGGTVSVVWVPDSLEDGDRFATHLVDLLQRGAYDVAGPMLESLAKVFPGSQGIHFNLGMMLSNQGKLDEAVTHLRQAVNLGDRPVDAWNALGVAFARQGNDAGALDAFAHACELGPENGHALRNYGGLLARKEPAKGLPYLRKAAALLPEDEQTLYGYALALVETGASDEADPVLRRAVDLAPHSQAADLCRALLTKIASKSVREATGGAPRMDVVHYMMAAMEKLEEIGLEAFKPIAFEIAMLGTKGLDVNNPAKKYVLKSMPGEFSGLQLVSYMYVGFEHLSPGMDQGIDLRREYALAKNLKGAPAE